MKAEMGIKISNLKKNTPLERKAQIIAFGYEDAVRWHVYNEDRKRIALDKAKKL